MYWAIGGTPPTLDAVSHGEPQPNGSARSGGSQIGGRVANEWGSPNETRPLSASSDDSSAKNSPIVVPCRAGVTKRYGTCSRLPRCRGGRLPAPADDRQCAGTAQ